MEAVEARTLQVEQELAGVRALTLRSTSDQQGNVHVPTIITRLDSLELAVHDLKTYTHQQIHNASEHLQNMERRLTRLEARDAKEQDSRQSARVMGEDYRVKMTRGTGASRRKDETSRFRLLRDQHEKAARRRSRHVPGSDFESDSEDSWTSDESQAQATVDSDSEEKRIRRRRSSKSRAMQAETLGLARGPEQKGLKILRSRNDRFNKVLSYRLYRFNDTRNRRSGRETVKVKNHIVRLEVTMRKFKFSMKDPVGILGFLDKFVRECNMLEMKEAQALLAVTEFLSGTAQSGLESAWDHNPGSETSVSTLPEAVNYLLRKLVTPANIAALESDLQDLKQTPGEDEAQFAQRVDHKLERYGRAFTRDDKATQFVRGLDDRIKALVEAFRDDIEEEGDLVSVDQLIKKAQTWGSALRPGVSAKKSDASLVLQKSPRHRSSALSAEQSDVDSHALMLGSRADSTDYVPVENKLHKLEDLWGKTVVASNRGGRPPTGVYVEKKRGRVCREATH